MRTINEYMKGMLGDISITAVAIAFVLTGVLALGGAGILPGDTALDTDAADAAQLISYKDGPVLYLSKGESRYLGRASIAAAAAGLGAMAGPAWAAAGAAVASVGDTYLEGQINRGRCLQVKMKNWNPKRFQVKFYKWTPCY